jgi:hypothetical protein
MVFKIFFDFEQQSMLQIFSCALVEIKQTSLKLNILNMENYTSCFLTNWYCNRSSWGKNVLLELYNQLNPIGVNIPNGFAVTAGLPFVSKRNNLEKSLDNILNLLDTKHYTNLSEVGQKARALILSHLFLTKYMRDCLPIAKQTKRHKKPWVAVRSSVRDFTNSKFWGKCSLSLILVVAIN